LELELIELARVRADPVVNQRLPTTLRRDQLICSGSVERAMMALKRLLTGKPAVFV
jgi:hypothetical protein